MIAGLVGMTRLAWFLRGEGRAAAGRRHPDLHLKTNGLHVIVNNVGGF